MIPAGVWHIPPNARNSAMWAVFGLTYVGMALGRFPWIVIDRAGIALLGGIGMLVIGGVTFPQAIAHIDFETLALLFGLMIFSAQLQSAGFYDAIGRRLIAHADRPKMLLAGVIGVSAAVSALLANDIVCLAFTPLLCSALLAAKRDPIPYLIALATGSNIGSAATIIGNPQNMYIGTVARLPFAHFTILMIPAVMVGLLLCWLSVVVLFRARLRAQSQASQADPARPSSDASAGAIRGSACDPKTGDTCSVFAVGKALFLLAALVVCFIFARGPWRAIAALAGAGLLLLSTRRDATGLQARVDWNLILLFVGLFIVNGAMQQHGLTAGIFQSLASHGLRLSKPAQLAGTTLVLSNVVSNVPAVLLLEPAVRAAQDPRLWYLLALVSTWAGNLTLVGSIANLIVAESAARFDVRLSLKTYCKVGVPLSLVTAAFGTAWLMWRGG